MTGQKVAGFEASHVVVVHRQRGCGRVRLAGQATAGRPVRWQLDASGRASD